MTHFEQPNCRATKTPHRTLLIPAPKLYTAAACRFVIVVHLDSNWPDSKLFELREQASGRVSLSRLERPQHTLIRGQVSDYYLRHKGQSLPTVFSLVRFPRPVSRIVHPDSVSRVPYPESRIPIPCPGLRFRGLISPNPAKFSPAAFSDPVRPLAFCGCGIAKTRFPVSR